MNETRRIALEFALRGKWRTSHDIIKVAALFEAYLSNNDAIISQILEEKSANVADSSLGDCIYPFSSMYEGTK